MGVRFKDVEGLLADLEGDQPSEEAMDLLAAMRGELGDDDAADWEDAGIVQKALDLCQARLAKSTPDDDEESEDGEDEDSDEDEEEDAAEATAKKKLKKGVDEEELVLFDPEELREALGEVDGSDEFLETGEVFDLVAKSFAGVAEGVNRIVKAVEAIQAENVELRKLVKGLAPVEPKEAIVKSLAARAANATRRLMKGDLASVDERLQALEDAASSRPAKKHPALRKAVEIARAEANGHGLSVVTHGKAMDMLSKALETKVLDAPTFSEACYALRLTDDPDAVITQYLPDQFEKLESRAARA